MTKPRLARIAGIAAAVALASVLLMVAAGCSSAPAGGGASGQTAKAYLSAAQSQLSTMAPGAKLLVVQTTNVVTATSTPSWGYLFGDTKSGKIYVVTIDKGKPSPANVYGQASLTATEWAQVPNADSWKIDSDAAFQKAAALEPKAAGSPYTMGFVTYMPKGTTSPLKAFEWSVVFEPVGSAPSSITVNATTGEAFKSK
jgi:hypothetical protein